jgi:hypothetical protein
VPGYALLILPSANRVYASAAAILAASGLKPVESKPCLQFRHRVDQAIVRDIVVARKPG